MDGSAGTAYEIDVTTKAARDSLPQTAFTRALIGFWFVHLPLAHPVLEWYAAYATCDHVGFEVVVVIIDPETYLDVEKPFDPTRIQSCQPIEGDAELTFQLPHTTQPENVYLITQWLVRNMVVGNLTPDRFEVGKWQNAKEHAIRAVTAHV